MLVLLVLACSSIACRNKALVVRLIVRQQDQYNFGVGVPIAKAHRPGDGVVGSPTSSPPQIEPFYSHRKIGNQDPISNLLVRDD